MELNPDNQDGWPVEKLEELIRHLSTMRGEMAALERQHAEELNHLPDAHRPSAKNLLHYLVLRRHDLRPLQEQLASFGLSSLGRSEAQVSANLDAVLRALYCMVGRPSVPSEYVHSDFNEGKTSTGKKYRRFARPHSARQERSHYGHRAQRSCDGLLLGS